MVIVIMIAMIFIIIMIWDELRCQFDTVNINDDGYHDHRRHHDLAQAQTCAIFDHYHADQVEFDASNSFEVIVSNAETNEAMQFNYNHQVRRERQKSRVKWFGVVGGTFD